MINWPKYTSGGSAESAWLNRMLGAARQCTPITIEGYNIEMGADGFRAHKKFQVPGAGGGSTLDANYKLMIITGFGSALIPAKPDLLICKAFDFISKSANGPDVYVAKDIEARQTNKEYYYDNGDNVTNVYTYFTATTADASYGDNFRLGNDGTNPELQVMEKRYYTKAMLDAQLGIPPNQALVWVVDTGIPTGVSDPTGSNVTRIEVKPVRVWIRHESQ